MDLVLGACTEHIQIYLVIVRNTGKLATTHAGVERGVVVHIAVCHCQKSVAAPHIVASVFLCPKVGGHCMHYLLQPLLSPSSPLTSLPSLSLLLLLLLLSPPLQIVAQFNGTMPPPAHSTPACTSSLLSLTLHCKHQILVGCCVFFWLLSDAVVAFGAAIITVGGKGAVTMTESFAGKSAECLDVEGHSPQCGGASQPPSSSRG